MSSRFVDTDLNFVALTETTKTKLVDVLQRMENTLTNLHKGFQDLVEKHRPVLGKAKDDKKTKAIEEIQDAMEVLEAVG